MTPAAAQAKPTCTDTVLCPVQSSNPSQSHPEKELKKYQSPCSGCYNFPLFPKAEGITFQVNARTQARVQRVACQNPELWCPFRTMQLLQTPPPQSLKIVLCKFFYTHLGKYLLHSLPIAMTLQFVRGLGFTDLNDLLQYPHIFIFNEVTQESSGSYVIAIFFPQCGLGTIFPVVTSLL